MAPEIGEGIIRVAVDRGEEDIVALIGDGGFGFEDFGARSNKYARGSTNGGEVMYFELDAVGNLSESSTLEVPVEVIILLFEALSTLPVPPPGP